MRTAKYVITQQAVEGVHGVSTQAYKRAVGLFCEHIKVEYGIKSSRQLEALTVPERTDMINQYVRTLQDRGLSPATIHTYIAPVCKGMSVPMQAIDKPKRTAGSITKSRDLGQNERGYRAEQSPEVQRLLQAQQCIGVRRSELLKLRGKDLQTDVNGNLCVHVSNGKDGKEQMQVVLPTDRAAVQALFYGIAPDQPIFSAAEIRKSAKIDLHSIRAAHARTAYKLYAAICAAGGADKLRSALLRTWDAYHPGSKNSARYKAQRERFVHDMDGVVYKLRGANRDRAVAEGRPTSYDRLALMCVSVWHLSHWRNDVTVKHYML